jgi:Tol biopolymer transport system component
MPWPVCLRLQTRRYDVDVGNGRLACAVAGAALALTAGASSASTSPSAGEATWSPDGSRLAYSLIGGAGHRADVFVAALDGSGRTNLTAGGGAIAYGEPAWSRDGRSVAYVATIRDGLQDALFGYVVANADGSASRQVGTSPTVGTPSFSADGRYIAFDGFEAVEVAHSDGSGQKQIAVPGGYPVFSPRINRVAFELVDRTDQGHIYTSSPTGSARARLTTVRGSDYPLAWSRGGNYLLFHTSREAFKAHGGQPDAVYAMRSDGTKQHRVGYGSGADFSPGAARIVFAGARGGLWTARLDGSGLRRLVDGTVRDPRWSPDGRWIAYTFTDGDSSRIELLHPDGSGRHVFAP